MIFVVSHLALDVIIDCEPNLSINFLLSSVLYVSCSLKIVKWQVCIYRRFISLKNIRYDAENA